MSETQIGKIDRLARKQYLNWQEKRQHETGAGEYPQNWIWMDIPKFADYYPKETAGKFIRAAKKHKIDPYDYLALGIAESGLGLRYPSNPSRINVDAHYENLLRTYPHLTEFAQTKKDITEHPGWQDMSIDYGAKLLSDAFRKYKDRLSAIQSYSGTGRFLYGGPKRWAMTPDVNIGEKKFFGKPSKEIDFWKEKPQARRVMEISSKIRTLGELSDYLNTFD